MNPQGSQPARSFRLPVTLRVLFWDYNLTSLSWGNDRDLIMAHVLTSGSWDAVTWLCSHAGPGA